MHGSQNDLPSVDTPELIGQEELAGCNNANQRSKAKQRPQEADDDFDIIEDVGDQALISYYNDSPSTPTRIPIMDNVK